MFTLPEVIALVDSRLTALEMGASSTTRESPSAEDLEMLVSSILAPHLEEFNHRYEILATEILAVKNVVMKLQSYTLDVNKMLVDERIRVMADPVFTLEESVDASIQEEEVEDTPVDTPVVEAAAADDLENNNITFVQNGLPAGAGSCRSPSNLLQPSEVQDTIVPCAKKPRKKKGTSA